MQPMQTFEIEPGVAVKPAPGRIVLAPLPAPPIDPAVSAGQRTRTPAIYELVETGERVAIDPSHEGLIELRERSAAGAIGRRYVIAPEAAIVARIGAAPAPLPPPPPPPAKPKRTAPPVETDTQAAARAQAEAAAREALEAAKGAAE